MSCSRINFASSVTGVSGLTQSTPLCIASLTFMVDLRFELGALHENAAPIPLLYNGSGAVARVPSEVEQCRKNF